MHITTLCLLQRCICLSLVGELVLPPEASQRLFFVIYIEDMSFQYNVSKVVHAALLPVHHKG